MGFIHKEVCQLFTFGSGYIPEVTVAIYGCMCGGLEIVPKSRDNITKLRQMIRNDKNQFPYQIQKQNAYCSDHVIGDIIFLIWHLSLQFFYHCQKGFVHKFIMSADATPPGIV